MSFRKRLNCWSDLQVTQGHSLVRHSKAKHDFLLVLQYCRHVSILNNFHDIIDYL